MFWCRRATSAFREPIRECATSPLPGRHTTDRVRFYLVVKERVVNHARTIRHNSEHWWFAHNHASNKSLNKSSVGFAPTCSTRCCQFDPRW